MQVKYDRESDILMLKEEPPVNAVSEPREVIVSYGDNDEPVSIEFLNASKCQLFNLEEANITLNF